MNNGTRGIWAGVAGVLCLAICGCLPWLDDEPANTPRVVLQITESRDPDAFDRMMGEIVGRGIKAPVMVTEDFGVENCQAIRDLHAQGYEIMLFARPELPTGESTTMSRLSREEQEEVIAGGKAALEACLEAPVTGFRATRFDQNEDTWDILDELGFKYNLTFVAGREFYPGHEDDTLPYCSDDYGTWAIPMHRAEKDGRLTVFCDNPFSDLPDSEWEALMKSELDRMRELDHPLVIEFHPYYSAVDEGRFEAFVNFLDYAVEQGAEFMTVAGYVEWVQDLHDDPICFE